MTRTDPLVERLRDAAAHVDVPDLDTDALVGRAVRTTRTRRAVVGGVLAAVAGAAVALAPAAVDRLDAAPVPAATSTPPAPSATGPRTADLPHVEGVEPGVVPEGWQVHETAGLAYALPPTFAPDEERGRSGPRYQRWLGGGADAVSPSKTALVEVSFGSGYAAWEVPDDAYVDAARENWDATVETAEVPGADHVVVVRQPFEAEDAVGTPAVQAEIQVREAGGQGYSMILWLPDSPRGEEVLRGFLGSLSFV